MRNIRSTRIGALVLGIAFALSAHAQLVTNGDFETGDFTGWTLNPALTEDPWTIENGGAYTGTFFASTGCVGEACIGSDSLSTTNYLYEDLSTVVNATYTVSFAFASGGIGGEEGGGSSQLPASTTRSAATEEELLATFGGVTVVDLVDVANRDFGFYSQNIVASSTTTRLEFQDREDPGFSGLDDISVTLAGTATPEPGTTLLGLGAALLFLVAVRLRKTHPGRAQTQN